jgi:hypothetical protein
MQQVQNDLYPSGRPLTEAERSELQGRLSVARVKYNTALEQQKLLLKKRDMLNVTSPIDGVVGRWQVERELLNRTVTPQSQLMTIMQIDGEWEIEIFMPEHRMGHITREHHRRNKDGDPLLPVTFILATKPSEKFTGRVVEIAETAEVRGEDGNTVKIRVAFDDQEAIKQALAGGDNDFTGIRPGAAVTAKIYCGEAPIGYVWLHDLVGWVQSKILFRF